MLVFFCFIILILLVIYFLGITIQIDNIEIEKENKLKINDIRMNIYFLLFNRLKFLKITIDKNILKKINIDKIKEKMKLKSMKSNEKMIAKTISRLNMDVIKLNINGEIGLNNVIYRVCLITIINIILSILFTKIARSNKLENYKYSIKPLQTDKIYLKISINCIIKIKMANIINMIIKNRSEEKNERSSNRSFNGNYHEQYPRYGRCKYYYRGTH